MNYSSKSTVDNGSTTNITQLNHTLHLNQGNKSIFNVQVAEVDLFYAHTVQLFTEGNLTSHKFKLFVLLVRHGHF